MVEVFRARGLREPLFHCGIGCFRGATCRRRLLSQRRDRALLAPRFDLNPRHPLVRRTGRGESRCECRALSQNDQR